MPSQRLGTVAFVFAEREVLRPACNTIYNQLVISLQKRHSLDHSFVFLVARILKQKYENFDSKTAGRWDDFRMAICELFPSGASASRDLMGLEVFNLFYCQYF